MRFAMLAIGAAVFLAQANPVVAQAQVSPGAQFMSNFNGVNPRNVPLPVLDASKAMKNLNINSAFKTPATTKPFSLSNVFPKINLPTFPPKVATTPILSQQMNPYQPTRPVGVNLFGQTNK